MFGYMVVSAKTEAPTQIGQLINWLYTDEGADMVWFGEENVDYIKQAGIAKRLVETNKAAIPEQYQDLIVTEEVYNQRQSEVPFFWYLYGWRLLSSMDDWLGLGTLIDPENETTKLLDWYSEVVEMDMIRGPNPEPRFTTEEGEQIIDLSAPVETLIDETITRMIIGDLSVEDDWDSFIETLKSMDYDKIIELHSNTVGR
jgi:putative aldouronate transport system substrate-binding protein